MGWKIWVGNKCVDKEYVLCKVLEWIWAAIKFSSSDNPWLHSKRKQGFFSNPSRVWKVQKGNKWWGSNESDKYPVFRIYQCSRLRYHFNMIRYRFYKINLKMNFTINSLTNILKRRIVSYNFSKSVLLFRHAKSDWFAPFKTDYERNLNKRGKSSAIKMGKFLSLKKDVPDLVIASSAKRAC